MQSAKSDGYPLTGSAINNRLIKEHKITLAELFGRRRPQADFNLEMASRWVLQEYAETGSWPSVLTEFVKAAECDGYPDLTGNALNKKLKHLGTTLKELKDMLRAQVSD